jgi:hypothetical protein
LAEVEMVPWFEEKQAAQDLFASLAGPPPSQ